MAVRVAGRPGVVAQGGASFVVDLYLLRLTEDLRPSGSTSRLTDPAVSRGHRRCLDRGQSGGPLCRRQQPSRQPLACARSSRDNSSTPVVCRPGRPLSEHFAQGLAAGLRIAHLQQESLELGQAHRAAKDDRSVHLRQRLSAILARRQQGRVPIEPHRQPRGLDLPGRWVGLCAGHVLRRATVRHAALVARRTFNCPGRPSRRFVGDLRDCGRRPRYARRVTSKAAGFNDLQPSWSPDSRWVHFTSNRSGRPEIWRVATGGGPATQFTRSAAAVR